MQFTTYRLIINHQPRSGKKLKIQTILQFRSSERLSDDQVQNLLYGIGQEMLFPLEYATSVLLGSLITATNRTPKVFTTYEPTGNIDRMEYYYDVIWSNDAEGSEQSIRPIDDEVITINIGKDLENN